MAFLIVIVVAWLVARRVLWVRRSAHTGGLYGRRWPHAGGLCWRASAYAGDLDGRPFGGRRELDRWLPPPPSVPRGGQPAPAEAAPEHPVARLQREWVAGRITDEEYERGLDAAYADPRRR